MRKGTRGHRAGSRAPTEQLRLALVLPWGAMGHCGALCGAVSAVIGTRSGAPRAASCCPAPSPQGAAGRGRTTPRRPAALVCPTRGGPAPHPHPVRPDRHHHRIRGRAQHRVMVDRADEAPLRHRPGERDGQGLARAAGEQDVVRPAERPGDGGARLLQRALGGAPLGMGGGGVGPDRASLRQCGTGRRGHRSGRGVIEIKTGQGSLPSWNDRTIAKRGLSPI